MVYKYVLTSGQNQVRKRYFNIPNSKIILYTFLLLMTPVKVTFILKLELIALMVNQ